MRLRKFGHCCLLVEEHGGRLLVDPGVFSGGFETLDGLSAVLVTHVHADHLDPDRLHTLLDRNPQARVVCDEVSASVLTDHGVTPLIARDGDAVDVGVRLKMYVSDHAVIHPDLPNMPNVGYLIADRLFYGGDSFITPVEPVEALAVPVGGAWMKLSESIDHLRRLTPRVVIPVHDHQDVWAAMACGLFHQLGPANMKIVEPSADEITEI